MTLVTMSKEEFSRVAVLQDLGDGRVGVDAAAALLGVTRRQVKAFLAEGPAGLASRKRGKPGNRRAPDGIRRQVLAIIRERYADFGPTLWRRRSWRNATACRSRARRCGLWMLADGLWQDRKARLKAVHQPRPRRDCVGELVQIDGSEHWWFEGRGPQCTLLVFVDDATSRYDKVLFLLEPTPAAKGLKRKRVTVGDYPDGRLKISHGGIDLPCRVLFDKISHVPQADVVENKRLGAVLAHIRAEQQKTDTQRGTKAPKRRSQAGDLFKVG